MPFLAEQADAGQAIYSKPVLQVYDVIVLGFFSRLIWRCPAGPVLNLHNRHVTGNHLDVGVGTGFFLDRCTWPMGRPRVGLMDLNPNCLEAAGRRIARFHPEIYRQNVLEPVRQDIRRFDSISLTWLLHCLPGSIYSKAAVFENLKTLLNPGGVVFGGTLLHGGVHPHWLARRLMSAYNEKGIFTNMQDDLEGLKAVLQSSFSRSSVEVVGCGALFSGEV